MKINDIINEAAPRLGDDPFKARDRHADRVFIGPNSAEWNDEAAKKAQAMYKAGANPREIWKKTGTWRGVDGNYRQEISDHDAGVNPERQNGKAIDAISHPKLFKAYPELADVNVEFNDEDDDTQGWFDHRTNTLSLSRSFVNQTTGQRVKQSDSDMLDTAMHELQHKIQGRENWEVGSNLDVGRDQADALTHAQRAKMGLTLSPEEKRGLERTYGEKFTDDEFDVVDRAFDVSARNAYFASAGELGATAAGDRRTMTPAQRQDKFPGDNIDPNGTGTTVINKGPMPRFPSKNVVRGKGQHTGPFTAAQYKAPPGKIK